jgi:2-polyprenyl-6-methoxyphenol hydroxylase-like FAD-dependent oxidoreductase
MHAIVIGAGPAGLSAAIALARISTPEAPITVTVLELRSKLSTIGGAVNLTPLALRYLDYLGVAQKVRDRGIRTSAIEMVSQRTGKSIANLWPNVDNLRVERSSIVESLMERITDLKNATVRFGALVSHIEEAPDGGPVKVEFRIGEDNTEILEGDVLVGCDGIHSFVRSKFVDPERKKEYSGRAGAYGYVSTPKPNDAGIRLVDKTTSAVRDTTMISAPSGSCLVSFFEPTRTKLYLAGVVSVSEEEALHMQNWKDSNDGFRLEGDRSTAVSADFSKRFSTPRLEGLKETIERAKEWFFFPVYMLSPGGVWSKGRVSLLGDAAHAVSIRT